MRINKCYRYRLNPMPEQEAVFLQWAGCRRFVWNYALGRRQHHFRETGKSLSFQDLCLGLTALKRELLWLKEADSQCLQQVLRDLDAAYRNFFEKRSGFPKRKKKFRTPNAFGCPERRPERGAGGCQLCRQPAATGPAGRESGDMAAASDQGAQD